MSNDSISAVQVDQLDENINAAKKHFGVAISSSALNALVNHAGKQLIPGWREFTQPIGQGRRLIPRELYGEIVRLHGAPSNMSYQQIADWLKEKHGIQVTQYAPRRIVLNYTIEGKLRKV